MFRSGVACSLPATCYVRFAPSTHVSSRLHAWRSNFFLQSGGYRRRVFLIKNALTRGYVPPPTLGGWRFAPNPARVQPVHPPMGFPLPRAGSAALPFAASCNLSRSTAQPAFLPRLWRGIPVPHPPSSWLHRAARCSVSKGQAASPLKNCCLSLALSWYVQQFFKP
jgi:hypothetical protein